MAYSNYVTGRIANKKAWDVSVEGKNSFVVGAFTTYRGDTMYANATWIGPTRKRHHRKKKKETSCRYRIIVTPKLGAGYCYEEQIN